MDFCQEKGCLNKWSAISWDGSRWWFRCLGCWYEKRFGKKRIVRRAN